MQQDIYLRYHVESAGAERWSEYNIDITTKITLPLLALSIYRLNYYDPQKTPIGIPNETTNQIRVPYRHAAVWKIYHWLYYENARR